MYRAREQGAKKLKEYLLTPFPEVPPLSDYAPYLASPRLDLKYLLPAFEWQERWEGFNGELQAWFSSLTGDEELPSPDGIQRHTRLDVEMVDIVLPLLQKGEEETYHTEGRFGLQFGNPELRVVRSQDRRSLLIGVMDLRWDSFVLARLFTYMALSGAVFGVATTLQETYFCKIEGSKMLVSDPLPRPATLGYGFVLRQARCVEGRLVSLPLLPLAPVKNGSSFNLKVVTAQLFELCKEVNTPQLHKILRGVQHLNFEDIESYGQVLLSMRNRRSLSIRRAVYRGKEVVIKLWDMTSPWDDHHIDFTMAHMSTEVDTLLHLHKLQGVYVPRLISWGFMHGGMFSFVITSYEGKRWGDLADEEGLGFAMPGLVEKLPKVLEGLRKIHARGIIHGDVCASKVVVSRGPGGTPSVKLTGFANSYRIADQNAAAAAVAEEFVEFKKVVEFLQSRCSRAASSAQGHPQCNGEEQKSDAWARRGRSLSKLQ